MKWTPAIGRAAASSLALWIVFSTAYILLRSQQFTAVDGALRCLAIYWHRPPYLGSNNHLLFPVDVWLWSRAVGLIGVQAAGPLAFVGNIQAMNALCAGGCVALVNLIAWRFTRSLQLSLTAAVAYGLTWAMLKHATNSAEPVVGLFISLIAATLVIEGLIRERSGLLFAGGLGLALALANYGSMIFVAPILYLLCFIWQRPELSHGDPARTEPAFPASLAALRRSILRSFACVGGTVAAAIAIYATAYYSLGIRGFQPMLRAFAELLLRGSVHFQGEGTVGFSLSNLLNLPVGMIGNLLAVLPPNYQGIRWLLFRDRDARAIAELAAVALMLGIALAMIVVAAIRRCNSRDRKLLGAVVFAALLLDVFLLAYRGPLYDKFWLQPLALLFICGAIVASWMDAGALRRFSFLAILFIGLEAFLNLPSALAAHSNPTLCLEDAREVAAAVKPDDRVVTDYDPVSTLWMALYDPQPSRTMLLPATLPEVASETLKRWQEECSRSGCRIFFVAQLDYSRDTWDSFLGKVDGIPFDSFDRYRQGSRVVDRFACEGASLRVYPPAS